MLDRTETNEALTIFARKTIREARQNLTKKGKNSSKRLYNSLDYDVKVNPNSIEVGFEMEDYGEYQDKGVSGKQRKFNTPYRYTNKQPPVSVFDRWSIRRGIAPRDERGAFVPRKSIQFRLSRFIFLMGIKPTHFFSRPFNQNFRKLPDEVIEAYGLDVENFMRQTLNAD